MVLNNLVPNKMNIMISTSELPNNITYNKIEPWFKTEYTDMGIFTNYNLFIINIVLFNCRYSERLDGVLAERRSLI